MSRFSHFGRLNGGDSVIIHKNRYDFQSAAGGRGRYRRVPHSSPAEPSYWGFETRQFGNGTCLIADREKAFLDLAYLAFTRRSPLELPSKRGRVWELNQSKLTSYARRFDSPALTAWLKENRLWVAGVRSAELQRV